MLLVGLSYRYHCIDAGGLLVSETHVRVAEVPSTTASGHWVNVADNEQTGKKDDINGTTTCNLYSFRVSTLVILACVIVCRSLMLYQGNNIARLFIS